MVQYVTKKDAKRIFQFIPLQTEVAQEILCQHQVTTLTPDTLLLLQGNELYDKSTALLKIVQQLPGVGGLLYTLRVVPQPVRDAVYTIIATNRYRLWGSKSACRWPNEPRKTNFLPE